MVSLNWFKRNTEEEILTKYVSKNDLILLVGPFVEQGQDLSGNNVYYFRDISLFFIIKKINNTNVTIIDIQGGDIRKSANSYAKGNSNLFITRQAVASLTSVPLKYVFSDALSMSFGENTFDVILDRITHGFIIGFRDQYSEERIDKLVWEYNRILKKGGKLIFFSIEENFEIHKILISKLRLWNYKVYNGKFKKSDSSKILKIEPEFRPFHKPSLYIVAIKK